MPIPDSYDFELYTGRPRNIVFLVTDTMILHLDYMHTWPNIWQPRALLMAWGGDLHLKAAIMQEYGIFTLHKDFDKSP